MSTVLFYVLHCLTLRFMPKIMKKEAVKLKMTCHRALRASPLSWWKRCKTALGRVATATSDATARAHVEDRASSADCETTCVIHGVG